MVSMWVRPCISRCETPIFTCSGLSPAPEKIVDDTEYESDDPSELSYFNQTDASAASASSEAPVLAPFVYHTPPPGPIAPSEQSAAEALLWLPNLRVH